MASFRPYNPVALAEQSTLDSAALERGGVVERIGYGFETPDDTPTVRFGWRLEWVDRRGMGNYGTAIILPTDARTEALWAEGQRRQARECGIPECYVASVATMGFQGELLFALAGVLQDKHLARLVLSPEWRGDGYWPEDWPYEWRSVITAWDLDYKLDMDDLSQIKRAVEELANDIPIAGSTRYRRYKRNRYGGREG